MAKKQHGGKRPGAGRKVADLDEGPTITMAASVPSSLVDKLDELAARKAWTRSRAVTEAIRGLLSAKPKR